MAISSRISDKQQKTSFLAYVISKGGRSVAEISLFAYSLQKKYVL